MAKLARTRAANAAGSNLPNDLFMLALLYFVFTGTISILVAPLGGVNLKTASLNVGFKFQSIRDTDCGRASSVRLVITTLRGSGLLPVGDPDLPVDLGLAKGVVVAEIVVDEILAGIHRRLDLVERRGRRAPEEQIRQRDLHAVLLLQPVDQLADRAGKFDRRVVLLRRRVERDRLAIVEELAFGTGAAHQGAHLVRTLDVHVRRRRMLQLLAIGQNALAGQFGRHPEALQGLQVRAHVLERLNRRGIDGIRRRRGGGRGAVCAWAPGAASDIASRPSARIFRTMVISRIEYAFAPLRSGASRRNCRTRPQSARRWPWCVLPPRPWLRH